MSTPPPSAMPAGARAARPERDDELRSKAGPRRPQAALAVPVICGVALAVFALLSVRNAGLFRTFAGGAGALLVWSAALAVAAGRERRALSLDIALYRHHWVQACAQSAVLLYWGWHVRSVYTFLPLILAQLIFAYGFESLLSLTRRATYRLGFGPFPVILSINLFLWFRPEWFHWQFAMIALGYAAKEFIRWNREGRSVHIFNPSSFPLAVFSLALILTGNSDITFGSAIASSQFYPPHMYVVIFAVALPGQLLFGVARMTVSAVLTLYAISQLYYAGTGTYLFYDTHIPVAIFLGMHLLFTDPSTSPRSEPGRIIFGMLYAVGTAAFYVLLSGLDVPTFYDKLLPVPLMNLLVRSIDRMAVSGWLTALDPSRIGRGWAAARRNVAYTSIWAGCFVVLSATRNIGDMPPGQSLAFWYEACRTGSARACEYATQMTRIYCENGSGWACNEAGVELNRAGRPAAAAFQRACRLGFTPGCANVGRTSTDVAAFARGDPLLADLPIVLRGTKPPLRGRSPAELHALACRQGWRDICNASSTGAPPARG